MDEQNKNVPNGGNEGVNQEQKKTASGDKRAYNGEKRSFGGDKGGFGGARKPFGGSRPAGQGGKPGFGGDRRPNGPRKPAAGGYRAAENGEKRPFGGDKPQNGERRPMQGGFRSAPQGEKRPFGGDRAQNGDRKPAFRGDKPAFRGDKPAFRGDKPAFRGDKMERSGDTTQNRGEKRGFGGDRTFRPAGKPGFGGKPVGMRPNSSVRPVRREEDRKPRDNREEGLPARRLALEVIRAVTERGEFIHLALDQQLKDCGLPTPFQLTDEHAIAISSAKTADEAGDNATLAMHAFLVGELGMNEHDAGMLLSIAGNLRVCQIVDPEKTFRMELPRSVTKAYGYRFR